VTHIQNLIEAPLSVPLPVPSPEQRDTALRMDIHLNPQLSAPPVINSSSDPPDYLRFQILLI
jgi:hypothetical protein